ncbi:hypothetical protein Phum_PHUM034620 [Pediculus humanus corporis]|uniref:Uncharacterized protein n=1 Tax=Pediculus humanus subsp. corporis TaxID=121224 RepID=E0VAC1_PEDHC|nr:uncharacterized protein Phum_PHUM034620 [Pediculus humanus corporis]EEB10327.1 hypothetical protein Phum_PHUM034620 [Pediculus humanus corporis]
MELTKEKKENEGVVDMTVTSDKIRSKKVLKPFSIESLISYKSDDEKNINKNKRDGCGNVVVKKISETMVSGSDVNNSYKPEKYSYDGTTTGVMTKESQICERVPGTLNKFPLERMTGPDMGEIYHNGFNSSFTGNVGATGNDLDGYRTSAGLPVNFLEKFHRTNQNLTDNISYNWPFIYNTWLHNTGLFFNASVNSAIMMRPQEYRSSSNHGQVVSPISPIGNSFFLLLLPLIPPPPPPTTTTTIKAKNGNLLKFPAKTSRDKKFKMRIFINE